MLQFPKFYFALLLLLPLWGTTFGDVSPYRIDEYHATAFPDCGKMKTKVVFEIKKMFTFFISNQIFQLDNRVVNGETAECRKKPY